MSPVSVRLAKAVSVILMVFGGAFFLFGIFDVLQFGFDEVHLQVLFGSAFVIAVGLAVRYVFVSKQ